MAMISEESSPAPTISAAPTPPEITIATRASAFLLSLPLPASSSSLGVRSGRQDKRGKGNDVIIGVAEYNFSEGILLFSG
jgi:hypothetical protein